MASRRPIFLTVSISSSGTFKKSWNLSSKLRFIHFHQSEDTKVCSSPDRRLSRHCSRSADCRHQYNALPREPVVDLSTGESSLKNLSRQRLQLAQLYFVSMRYRATRQGFHRCQILHIKISKMFRFHKLKIINAQWTNMRSNWISNFFLTENAVPTTK